MGARFQQGMGRYEPTCGGRCLVAEVGGDNCLPGSCCLILVPTCCWAGFIAPYLLREGGSFVVLVVVGILLLFSSLLSLAAARCIEPGILHSEDVEGVQIAGGYTKKIAVVDGKRVELATRRAKYVRETEVCVEKFDHFCPWVGNAVGQRNYRYFVGFLTSTNLLALHVLATTVLVAAEETRRHDGGFGTLLEDEPILGLLIVVLVIYLFFILCCVGSMWYYHARLICNNLTTNEDIKRTFENVPNPYDAGCICNCVAFCCAPSAQSHVSTARHDEAGAGGEP